MFTESIHFLFINLLPHIFTKVTFYILVTFCFYRIFYIDSQFSLVQFSRSVMSDSLQPHELQHTRPPCPSPTPGVHPNPCPLSHWCHPTISSSVVPFSSCPPSIRVFSNELALRIRWPKYWSFSMSSANEDGFTSLVPI